MTVRELSQLYNLNREIEMDQRRLDALNDEIQRDEERLLELELQAVSVSSPRYDGMPKNPSNGSRVESMVAAVLDLREGIKRRKTLRDECAVTIQAKQILCLTERNRLERYIAELPTSLLRMIFTYRFVNGLNWRQVSESVGMHTTEDSVKKLCYRHLSAEKQGQK